MIGSLRGRLLSKKPGDVIVETAGVGYQLNITVRTLSELPEEGKEVFFHVYTHVREDAIQLYGFREDEEKRIFTTLLNVSGIGPKVAMNILSGLSHEDFLKAVESEDIDMLSRAPGVGKKTAQRIVLELRGKLSAKGARDSIFDDTLSALINFGYRRSDVVRSIEKARAKGLADVEGLLKESLKYLSGADEKD